jgi:predicted ABC-class ATPase
MKTTEDLKKILIRINGRGYKAYKDIRDTYAADIYTLIIDHVQGDPFAAPSRIRVRLTQKEAGFPEETYTGRSRNMGAADYLTRCFNRAAGKICGGIRGTGKSGTISIDRPGQEVLPRTSVFINADYVEARFVMGLPARGRKIESRTAEKMFFHELPQIVEQSLVYKNLNREELTRHAETSEDADFLREELDGAGLIAFVADGSVLPRKSGIDQAPMDKKEAVLFRAPESLRVDFTLPNRGEISGMGIKKGITLIVGGGYHGKSTLMNALERGIYNHVPGDGREFVVAGRNAVKIRAEDGRRIEKTCISPFISNLPFNRDTDSFSTEDASGSTSQSANIIEAIEAGAEILMIDEDTSATNFMIRDHRMQELVAKEREPITPFIDKVEQLRSGHGISTVLVIGGSGDYFDVADTVICMVEYLPEEVSGEASRIAEKYKAERSREGGSGFGTLIRRIPSAKSLDPSRGKKEVKIDARGTHGILFGREEIDLSGIEQIVSVSQTRAIGDALCYSRKYMDGVNTLGEVAAKVEADIITKGLDILGPWPAGNYAGFRKLELAAAINRLRTLKVQQEPK